MGDLSWGSLKTSRRTYFKGVSLYVDRDKDAPLPKHNQHYGTICISSIETKTLENFIDSIVEDLEPGDTATLVVDHIEEETRTKHRLEKLIIRPLKEDI